MKQIKSITLNVDIIEKLKEVKNASALINKLLDDYFKIESYQTEEELQKRLNIIEIEEKAKKEIEEIKHG